MRRNLTILPILTLTLLASCSSSSSSSTSSKGAKKEYEKVNVVNFDFSKLENIDPDNAIAKEDIVDVLNSCSDVDYNLFSNVSVCQYVYAINHKNDEGISKNLLKFSTIENSFYRLGAIHIDFADSITFNYAKIKYLAKYSDTNSMFNFGATYLSLGTTDVEPDADGIAEYGYSLDEYSYLDLCAYKQVYVESMELALIKEKTKG